MVDRERRRAHADRQRRLRPRGGQPAARRPARRHPPAAPARPHRGQARAGPAGGRAPARAAARARARPRRATAAAAGSRAATQPRRAAAGRRLDRHERPRARCSPACRSAALEFANILLTEPDAQIASTPKDVVWTHRKTTLYRYRSTKRRYAVPVLLVFALINRPTSSTCARATRSSSSCSRRASTSSCSTGACPTRRTPTWASSTTSATRSRGACARRCAPSGQEEVVAARLVHRRHAVPRCTPRSSPTVRCATSSCSPRPIDTTGSLYATGSARHLRRRPRRRRRWPPSPAPASTSPTS